MRAGGPGGVVLNRVIGREAGEKPAWGSPESFLSILPVLKCEHLSGKDVTFSPLRIVRSVGVEYLVTLTLSVSQSPFSGCAN